MPEGDVRTDDAKCVPPSRAEMKVRKFLILQSVQKARSLLFFTIHEIEIANIFQKSSELKLVLFLECLFDQNQLIGVLILRSKMLEFLRFFVW